MTTPNMGLTLPSVGVTLGPTWASELNTALETIDSHGHTGSDGVLITTAALDINAALDCNDYALTSVGYLALTSQDSALSSGDLTLFSYGGELYYRDASSNNVRITLSGAVDAGATGAITGLSSPAAASYSSITKTFSWTADTDKYAKMSSGDLVIHEYNTTSTNPVTIKSPASLGASYSITLPAAVPAATYPLTMSAAGVLENTGSIAVAGLTFASGGTASAPTVAVTGDSNTGIYQAAASADTLSFTTGGTARLTISSSAITPTVPIANPVGSAGAPSYTFTGDTNTGFYHANADRVDVAIGGALNFSWEATGNTSQVPIWSSVGSAGAPSFAFGVDTDTGLYRVGANNPAISAGGTQVQRWDGGGTDITGVATISDSLNIASGGAFKVKIYTGSLAASTTSSAFTPGGTILGAFGYTSNSGSSTYISIEPPSYGGTNRIRFDSATSTTVKLFNPYSGSNTYQLVVFYQ